MIISADRKRKNLGQIYKPSVPRRNIEFGPKQERGFFPCTNKCDTCAHSKLTKNIKSPWDGRNSQIRQHITCTTPFVVYLIYCTIHNVFYTGSTVNLKLRWANHKSDKFTEINKMPLSQTCNSVSPPLFETA